jgi:hypothetical protein
VESNPISRDRPIVVDADAQNVIQAALNAPPDEFRPASPPPKVTRRPVPDGWGLRPLTTPTKKVSR